MALARGGPPRGPGRLFGGFGAGALGLELRPPMRQRIDLGDADVARRRASPLVRVADGALEVGEVGQVLDLDGVPRRVSRENGVAMVVIHGMRWRSATRPAMGATESAITTAGRCSLQC